ncbi:hypothetical protein DP113_32090 [Brasilonema octagenarum UFV-E1]|uniref:Uncharacterized protein n=2 Tax=Brasilonema TaxID=383614 RepID=A0A856MNC0_9CYAN|nr:MULTISPECIES: hypothetical protein [Brasilonema]NMF64824.1 hypothetical protein [Brasilonema octagenarum UFV-OR1]QDL11909.1 hypothetical protein DP114_31990 [Brasilonema sennae CENA114]QDL18283.1 hypothetical protein DP113_32090 [Brasilonema octagenarum UFV-E1]
MLAKGAIESAFTGGGGFRIAPSISLKIGAIAHILHQEKLIEFSHSPALPQALILTKKTRKTVSLSCTAFN